jgi:tetratricopeptide (TPR) repeat protein
MLWLYGVAWHQPMAESIAWARDDRRGDPVEQPWRLAAGGLITAAAAQRRVPRPAGQRRRPSNAGRRPLPSDPELDREFAERRRKRLEREGPRMLARKLAARGQLCTWTELELANAESYRCLGNALQAQGYHQDAIAAFRKAKQYDPSDTSLDAAIDRSQKGIVADFPRARK